MTARPADASPATRLEAHFGDRVVRCFVQRPGNLHAMLLEAVDRRPHEEALVCRQHRLTWLQTHERCMRLAAGLQRLGLGRGDRIALLLGNGLEFPLLTFAALALGAVVVPISPREQTPGITHLLQHSGAKALCFDAVLADRLPAAGEVPGLAHRIAVAAAPGTPDAFEALLEAAPLDAADGPAGASLDEEALAAILYTSGTTGRPKGAMLTHFNIVQSVMNYQQVLGLRDGERACITVPFSHVTGLVALLMVTVRTAGTLVIVPAFRAGDFLALAARERMTFTVMVPAMYALCLLEPGFEQHDLSAWRVGGFGGAPMPTATLDDLARRLPRLALANCYGATETTSPATIMPPHLTRGHPASVGLPVACAEIAVMDDHGREVPAGEVGELWLKGPMVVAGYWNDPAATAGNIVGGFWRSGDLGRIDGEGFVHVLDRRKDMLSRGGYKIYSVEVENVLCQHPAVLEAAIVGRPCPVLGERVHAIVAAKAGHALDAAELRAFCARRLADYKVPESFTLGAEPLPRNANGKLMKRSLREELLARWTQVEGPR